MSATVEDLIAIDRRYSNADNDWKIFDKMKALCDSKAEETISRLLWQALDKDVIDPSRLRSAWYTMGKTVDAYDGALFMKLMHAIVDHCAEQTDPWRAKPWGDDALPGWPMNFHAFANAKKEAEDDTFFVYLAQHAKTLPKPYSNAVLYHSAKLGSVAPSDLPPDLLPWAAQHYLMHNSVELNFNPWPDAVWNVALVEACVHPDVTHIQTKKPEALRTVLAHATPRQAAVALHKVVYTTNERLPVFEALKTHASVELRDAVANALQELDDTQGSRSGEWDQPDPRFFLSLGYLKLCQALGTAPDPACDPAIQVLVHTYVPSWSGGYFDAMHKSIRTILSILPTERLEAIMLSAPTIPLLCVGVVPTPKVIKALIAELVATSNAPYYNYSAHVGLAISALGKAFAPFAAEELLSSSQGGARRQTLLAAVAKHGDASCAPALVACLKDKSKKSRETARLGILRLPATKAIDAVADLLDARAKQTREEAATILVALPPNARSYALAQARLAKEKTSSIKALLQRIENVEPLPDNIDADIKGLADSLSKNHEAWHSYMDKEEIIVGSFMVALGRETGESSIRAYSRDGSLYGAWLHALEHLGPKHTLGLQRAIELLGACSIYNIQDYLSALDAIYSKDVIGKHFADFIEHGRLKRPSSFEPYKYGMTVNDAFELLLERYPKQAIRVAISMLGNSRKTNRTQAKTFLVEHKHNVTDAPLIKALKARKKDHREAAAYVLGMLERVTLIAPLENALAHEKNAAVKQALREALVKLAHVSFDPATIDSDAELDTQLGQQPTVPLERALTLATLPRPRWRTLDTPISQDALAWLVSELTRESMEHAGNDVRTVCQRLVFEDLTTLCEAMLKTSTDNGMGWRLFIQAFVGSDARIESTGRLLETYARSQQYRWSEDAVEMLVRRGTVQAVCILDEFSRKTKRDAGRSRARAGLSKLANLQGLTVDELLESAIDTMGFDTTGVRTFDYGGRTIEAHLAAEGKLSFIERESGKRYASMPKAKKSDINTNVKAAMAEVSQIKKDLKRVHKAQIKRLHEAMLNGRRWAPDVWQLRYAQHPLMRTFAQGIVWGLFHGDGAPSQTFAIHDDSTFQSHLGDAIHLSAPHTVGIVHPIWLSADEHDGWQNYFAHANKHLSINQLHRNVRHKSDVPELAKWLLQLRQVNASMFVRTADHLGFTRGSRGDGGSITEIYRTVGPWNIRIDHTWYVPEILSDDHSMEVEGLAVYKTHNGKRTKVALHDLPNDIFSELVCDMHLITKTLLQHAVT